VDLGSLPWSQGEARAERSTLPDAAAFWKTAAGDVLCLNKQVAYAVVWLSLTVKPAGSRPWSTCHDCERRRVSLLVVLHLRNGEFPIHLDGVHQPFESQVFSAVLSEDMRT
jgi:hypothetical protein